MTMLEPIQEKIEAYSVCWVRQVVLYTHRHVVHVNSIWSGSSCRGKQQLLGLYSLFISLYCHDLEECHYTPMALEALVIM